MSRGDPGAAVAPADGIAPRFPCDEITGTTGPDEMKVEPAPAEVTAGAARSRKR